MVRGFGSRCGASIGCAEVAGHLDRPRRVAREFLGIALDGVQSVTIGEVYQQLYASSPGRLGLRARERIAVALEGLSVRRIAVELGRAASTVTREMNRNGGRAGYLGVAAHGATCERARPPEADEVRAAAGVGGGRGELVGNLPVVARPRSVPGSAWSFPTTLRCEWHPRRSIRRCTYTGGAGLRKELAAHLRTGARLGDRAPRPPATAPKARSRIWCRSPNVPTRSTDRLVPGHWEGDLIMGRDGQSQVATLVERTTGLVMLGELDNKQAPTVAARLQERIQTCPITCAHRSTWDRGTEMADHASSPSPPGSRSTSATPTPLATRQQREHQRTAPPIPTPRHRPLALHPNRARRTSPTNSTTGPAPDTTS